jgi:hypothetical protein
MNLLKNKNVSEILTEMGWIEISAMKQTYKLDDREVGVLMFIDLIFNLNSHLRQSLRMNWQQLYAVSLSVSSALQR